MEHIEDEIFSIDEIDVTVIGVGPSNRPRVDDFEPVSAILEAGLAPDDFRVPDGKGVLAAKAGAEFLVRDVSTFPRGATVTLLSLLVLLGVGFFLFLLFRRFRLVLFGRLGLLVVWNSLVRFCFGLFLLLWLWLFPRFLRASEGCKEQEENGIGNSDMVHGAVSFRPILALRKSTNYRKAETTGDNQMQF